MGNALNYIDLRIQTSDNESDNDNDID
jgi:hypothetical protein